MHPYREKADMPHEQKTLRTAVGARAVAKVILFAAIEGIFSAGSVAMAHDNGVHVFGVWLAVHGFVCLAALVMWAVWVLIEGS